MTLDALGNVGEFIGALGVIASLFYLAVQVRRSMALARAQSQREISNLYAIHHVMILQPDQIEINRRGYKDFSALSKDEQARFHHLHSPLLQQCELVSRMHRQGLVEDDSYQGWRSLMLSILSTPGGRQWWPVAKTLLGPDLVRDFDTALSKDREDIVPVDQLWPFYGSDE